MKKTVLAVTAICLAAVLLCSAACLGTAAYVKRETAQQASAAAAAPVAAAPVRLESLGGNTLSANQIYQLACKQVVGISTEILGYNMFGQQTANAVSGTGFVISEDGYILTNNHVVEDAFKGGYDVTVKFYDGSEYTADIVGVEDDNDVAVLKIDAKGLTPVTLGDSDKMLVGDNLYVVGNPLGELTYTMTSGIVSALDRAIATSANVSVNMFQLDAAVNSGNSGGPVYNAKGEVIGVVTAKYKDAGVEGLGFAIPVNDAAAIAKELIDHGYVTGKAYLGVTVTTLTEAEAMRYNTLAGVYVYSVDEGSCAEKAGIRQGDIIMKLNDTKVRTTADLTAAKKDFKAGDSCRITVYRSGEMLELKLTFDEEPPAEPGTAVTPAPVPTPVPAPQETPDDTPEETPEGEAPADPFQMPEGGADDFWGMLDDFFREFSDFFGDGGFGSFFGGIEPEEPADEPEGGFRHFGS